MQDDWRLDAWVAPGVREQCKSQHTTLLSAVPHLSTALPVRQMPLLTRRSRGNFVSLFTHPYRHYRDASYDGDGACGKIFATFMVTANDSRYFAFPRRKGMSS